MNIEEIRKKLHEINFGPKGIVRPEKAQDKTEDYTFRSLIRPDRPDGYKDWVKRCHKYPGGQCYCTECNGISPLTADGKDGNYQFTSITHGTHTLDFLDAHFPNGNRPGLSDWPQKPVLFVFENPGSVNSGNYGDGVNSPAELPTKEERLPCKWWYWINGQDDGAYKDEDFIYPKWFVQKEYGWMIYSVIRTFKMANAYVTNMVKCGIGNLKEYLTTDKYNHKIVKQCIGTHLKHEINALRGENKEQIVTVFAFGQNVYDELEQCKDELGNCEIYILPHPANRLANDYRKYVLFGKILRGLLKTKFYEGVKLPDFYDILCQDNADKKGSSNSAVLTKRSLQDFLSKYLEGKSGFTKSADYIAKTFAYQVSSNTYGLQVIFRYSSDKKANYTVSWACYYPEIGEIYLYRGKNKAAKSAKVFVDCNHGTYEVYNQIVKFARYLKEQTPRLKDYGAVTELDEG